MATIRERIKENGTRAFHVQVRISGFPARTASFRTKREAERWAKTIEAEMIEGRHFRSVESRRRTVIDAIDRYIAEELPKKGDGAMHKTTLAWWRKKIGNKKISEVTPALIAEHKGILSREKYQRSKPDGRRTSLQKGESPKLYTRSSGTVNRYLSVLSHVFTVARKEWHWISNNPFDGVSKLKEPGGRTRHLSEDERRKLLDETGKYPELHCFVILALSTSCRAGDLLKLEWSDVNLNESQILFRKTKNREPRTAWLNGAALRLLTEHFKKRQICSVYVFNNKSGKGEFNYSKPFKQACDTAGIKHFRFHDLRHTAATELAKLGASEQQLKAIGGWKSNIVSRYVHLAANDSKDIVAKMNNKIIGG